MTDVKTIAAATHGWQGMIDIPGDKSISHRSVMFAGIGNTPVHIKNFLHAADCLSTVGVMRALGVNVEFLNEKELIVTGRGLHGFSEPLTVPDDGPPFPAALSFRVQRRCFVDAPPDGPCTPPALNDGRTNLWTEREQ